jgi:hypothetical protein
MIDAYVQGKEGGEMCSIPGFDYRVDLVRRWRLAFCCNMDGGNRVLVIICIWEGWRGGRKDVDEANFCIFFHFK